MFYDTKLKVQHEDIENESFIRFVGLLIQTVLIMTFDFMISLIDTYGT